MLPWGPSSRSEDVGLHKQNVTMEPSDLSTRSDQWSHLKEHVGHKHVPSLLPPTLMAGCMILLCLWRCVGAQSWVQHVDLLPQLLHVAWLTESAGPAGSASYHLTSGSDFDSKLPLSLQQSQRFSPVFLRDFSPSVCAGPSGLCRSLPSVLLWFIPLEFRGKYESLRVLQMKDDGWSFSFIHHNSGNYPEWVLKHRRIKDQLHVHSSRTSSTCTAQKLLKVNLWLNNDLKLYITSDESRSANLESEKLQTTSSVGPTYGGDSRRTHLQQNQNQDQDGQPLISWGLRDTECLVQLWFL